MHFPAHSRPLRGSAALLLLSILVAAQGCAIKLISSYDETTDKAVSELQRKTEAHLVSLEAAKGLPACSHEKHRTFYETAKVDVSAIAIRAAAIPNNAITLEQTQLLSGSFNNLEQLHKIACLSPEQIAPLRIQFNSSFTAILKLELAKRRGE